MELSDKQLLKKARQGDEESLRLIYLGHKDRLFTIARALLHDRDLAEDIVQDVFVAFARGLKDLRLRGSLGAYLSVSVCNRARDIIRARVRREGKLEAAIEPQEGTDSPETVASHAEAIEQLREALQSVPLEQREVLLLRTQAGLTFKEIAKRQGTGVNTAQGRFRYGVSKLRLVFETARRSSHDSRRVRKTN